MTKVCVVVPLYNESSILLDLLARIKEIQQVTAIDRIYFSDDFSTDSTLDILKTNADGDFLFICHGNYGHNKGYGAAISRGLRVAKKHGMTWAIIMDSDLSNPLREVDHLARSLKEGEGEDYVLYKGSRYRPWLSHEMHGIPARRRALSFLGNWISRLLTLNVHPDPTNGFRALKISFYENQLVSPGFSIILEEMLLAIRQCKNGIKSFGASLRWDEALRNKSSFNLNRALIQSYLEYSFLIGVAHSKRAIGCIVYKYRARGH